MGKCKTTDNNFRSNFRRLAPLPLVGDLGKLLIKKKGMPNKCEVCGKPISNSLYKLNGKIIHKYCAMKIDPTIIDKKKSPSIKTKLK